VTNVILALVQLFKLSNPDGSPDDPLWPYARPLGGCLVTTGMLALALGVCRYFAVQRALVGGKFPVSRRGVSLLAGVLGVVVAVVFGVVVAVGSRV
jgi:uncharacterized membrane protein YidH (DUF202 family)